MRKTLWLRGWIALMALSALPACSDAVNPPAQRAVGEPSLSSTTYGATLLECPASEDSVASTVIGPLGGSLQLNGHRMDVPLGALLTDQKFVARVRASNYMEVDFSADGQSTFEFLEPVSLTIDYSRCNRSNVEKRELRIYHIDPVTKAILADLGGTDDKAARKITTRTGHLSDYAVGTPY